MRIEKTIAIASTFTADPVTDSIQFWLELMEMSGRIVIAPPFQLLQALVDPSSILRMNSAGLNVILVRWDDLVRRDRFEAGTPVKDLAASLQTCANETSLPHLVISCPSRPEASGPYHERLHGEWDEHLRREFEADSKVSVATAGEIQALYPVARVHDSYGDDLAAIPYAQAMFAAIGTVIARKFHMVTEPPYKAIAVDCDNTLWGGVCGEEGPEGIVLDPPHLALQHHLIEQYQKGMLLCLCSKNNAEDTAAVFQGRQDMPLKFEHFASQRINWTSKAENLLSMAEELGIAADSFIFLDDNPVEREAMRIALPEVLTLQLPARTAHIPDFLRRVWAFDRPKATKEDRVRTLSYHQVKERERLRKTAATLEEFLASLKLRLGFESLNETQLTRASQLTYRVNQFNLTTIRRTEAELAALIRQQHFTGLLVKASDRFGDYGIVGLILFGRGYDAFEVDTFVLSCRALGRGVEHRVVAELAAMAKAQGLNLLDLKMAITPKNRPAKDFLDTEFAIYRQRDGESFVYRIPVDIAQDLQPRSKAAIESTAETAPGDSPSARFGDARQPGIRSSLLAEIASTLSDSDKILSCIETWKRNSQAPARADGTPPRTEIEQTLAEIWAEVLGLEKVGIRDNFLSLGGDSLKMVQVIVRIYGQLGVDFPISTFFESPTIEEHALKLAQQLSASA